MLTENDAVPTRLAWLWVFVMLNLILADIFSFMSAGFLEQVLEGRAGEITITPVFLLVAAVVTSIPAAMVVLTQLLPGRVSRWLNVVVGIATIAYIWVGGSTALPHYVFLAGLETIGCLSIAWIAWRWRDPAGRALVADLAPG